MDTFKWNKHFVTGLPAVDDQHCYLVEMLNKYGELVASSDQVSPDSLNDVFQQLKDYSGYHFKEEEKLMTDHGVVGRYLHDHQTKHLRFMKEAVDIQQAIKNNLSKPSDLLKFLIHWLAYHILRDDQIMARQIKLIKSGVDPEEAFFRVNNEEESATEPLLAALNGLFGQVSARNQQLKTLNRSLEEKVLERTEALSEANRRLKELANTDQLTGLPNRRQAMAAMQRSFENAKCCGTSLCCVVIDADDFKQVNDQFGHDAGDAVLKKLSRSLVNTFRTDDLVARLGGDEFLVILENTDLHGAHHITEQAREAVSELKVHIGGFDVWQGSISAGIAALDAAMGEYSELIKQADTAVYESKKKGRNCVSMRLRNTNP